MGDLREITFVSVGLRMLLAVLCGGIIGIERETKRRPAGFRTHILICLGAAMTTLTSQYLFLYMGYFTDIARLGAQVVAGIGFIGAGTIIVTKGYKVKGLTTAAGLWVDAIVGLAAGAGFYEGAILTTVLIMLAELVFFKLEYRWLQATPEITLYLEYVNSMTLEKVLTLCFHRQVRVLDMEIARSEDEVQKASVFLSLRLPKKYSQSELLSDINQLNGIISVNEL
jgi:putative Mg2+ transporter-C (MgtC) family protein